MKNIGECIVINPRKTEWSALTKRAESFNLNIEQTVNDIIGDVKLNGDEALKKYSECFDGVIINNIKVSKTEVFESCKLVIDELKDAIQVAAFNINKFHKSQKIEEPKVETIKGVVCWRKSVAIERVGLYIPGGTAPLFSTVLMLGIPAKIVGCKEVVLCTPPDKNGEVNPAILYAANLVGIKEIYKIGGAQAIAAMAYGTKTLPKVYKIFGPGNSYVTMAKMLVSKTNIAIDMPAGPSEVMIVADKTANPQFIAADMLSQAEHDVTSQAILLSNDIEIIKQTIVRIKEQISDLSRSNIIEQSLKNSRFILLDSKQDSKAFINEYAPEHLILSVENVNEWVDDIYNAGSVFLGNYTPESAGDYASGTNHTLPTNGFAKCYSGLSIDSFVKKISFQSITEKGLLNIADVIETMAEAEQLTAHKNAVNLRVKSLLKSK